MRSTPPGLTTLLCGLPLALAANLTHAQTTPPSYGFGSGNGKLLLTGGVSSIDGAAGGGLTPWAVTGSYATTSQFGATAFLTRVSTKDYGLTDYGVAFGYGDRAEVSLAHQDFSTGPVAAALAGLLGDPSFNGLHLKQDILGVKVRVAGDAVLDSDTLMPQIAVGLEYKQSHTGPLAPVLEAFGAKKNGTDFHVSATKLFLAQGILVNGTLRATKANQNGLLGFGATGHDSYTFQPEVSVAYLLSKSIAIGAEYRFKPDNFRDNTAIAPGALGEGNWKDVFVAWAPTKNVSVTAAFVDLSKIVPGVANRRQTGGYLSAQIAF